MLVEETSRKLFWYKTIPSELHNHNYSPSDLSVDIFLNVDFFPEWLSLW